MGGRSNPSVTYRCSSLLPSASADGRSSDDVIVSEGNQVLLDKMQSYASSSTAAMRTFAYDLLGVSFTPHVETFSSVQNDVGFFGFGCGSSTWQWHSDFAKKLTGCSRGTVHFHLNSRMTCTSSGYNSGHFSGPRICACK